MAVTRKSSGYGLAVSQPTKEEPAYLYIRGDDGELYRVRVEKVGEKSDGA